MKKRVISLLLALALCLTLLPAMALADDGSASVGAVAKIGANTYASLAAAVKAAAAGAKIELTDDDASEQRITIDKNLSIELNGHNLPSTCFTITHGTVSIRNSAADGGEINKDSEIVADKVSDSVSTSYSLINDIRATISVFGDAQVTLHNLNVGSSGAVVEANPKLKPVYIGGSGAKLTINGGSYVGKKTEGTDGIFFYNGGDSELTINAGYFEGNCGLSVYPKPDTSKLHIVGGRFVGKASALWIDGNASGKKAVTTKSEAEKFIDTNVSRIDGAFDRYDITVSSKLFLADGSTGSTKQNEPDQITLSGESVTLAPEILGGTGERTYKWEKDGTVIDGETGATLNVTEAGSYTLTVTAGEDDTLTVYYTVTASEHAHPICGEECAHHGAHSEEISDWVGVASLSEITKAGHYYLTENVDLSERWVAVNNVVLCLNGKNITEKNGNEEVFYIGRNTSFAITDCHTGEDMGKLTHKSGAVGRCVVVAEKGNFTLYGGNITGSRSSYSGVGVDNSGSFTMYGGAITKNETTDNTAHGAGVSNSGTFTMYGGEISDNITQGYGGGVYNSGTLVVSGDVRITGNTKSGNSTKNNVYLEWNKVITIGENGLGENAKIGVTLRDWPAAGTTTEVANSATGGDQEHIISDNDRYEVSYDDGKLVVGVKVEKHEHFLCTTGESCTGVGGHEETGKVTFVKWTDELVKAQYNNSETHTAKNSLPKKAGYYYLDENVSLNSSWDAVDGVVLCLNGHSVTQENSERFLFEVGNHYNNKLVAITVTDCKDSGTIGYPDSRPKMEKDVGVIVGQNGTFNLYGGTIQSCSVGVKIYKDGDKQGTFNMYGGKITGNTYGGVRIEGTFNMYAGAITGNTFLNSSYTFGNDILEGYAGGVYNSDGTFNMYGGSITNNTASGNTGGGVCVFGSVTTISGNATITGNKIYIDEDTLIDCNVRTASPIAEITDGFTGSIGVTAYVWPEAGVERAVVSKANSATGVTSDRDDYEVLCKDGKLYVVKKDSPKEDQDKLEVVLPEGGDKLAYGETMKLDTTGGNGSGDVSWKVVGGTGEATIDEKGVLTPVKAGTVIIKAVREGDENYNEAESETVTITIVKGKLTGAPSYTPITADGKTLKDAALEPNASWPEGTLTWVDAEGNVLDETTVVEANATYKWKFTPENENYESLTGSYTLYEKSGGDDDDGPHKPSNPVINPTRPSTSNGSQTTSEPECPFRDVSKSDYSYKAITWAAENGIAGGIGNGLFDPNGPCTRAQIVTFLWRAAGSPAPKALSGFVDVPADAYYAKAVAWAVENGITKGTSATTFSPDDICTRAQAVTFLFRAVKAKANGVSTVFRDVAPTAYYAGAVKWAVDNEVTDGIGNGLFGPDNACTRAQIVTFLWRLYAD